MKSLKSEPLKQGARLRRSQESGTPYGSSQRQQKKTVVQAKLSPPAPPAYRPQLTPTALQPKAARTIPSPTSATHRQPVAPPVYRPQATPKVLQQKPFAQPHRQAGRNNCAPVAPPVYRPQPVPKVLQAKLEGERQAINPGPNRAANAPPPYRPQPIPRVLQRKTSPSAQRSETGQQPANRTASSVKRAGTTAHAASNPASRVATGAASTVLQLHPAAGRQPSNAARQSTGVNATLPTAVRAGLLRPLAPPPQASASVIQRSMSAFPTVTEGRTPRTKKPNSFYPSSGRLQEDDLDDMTGQMQDVGGLDDYSDVDYQEEDDQPQPGDFIMPGDKEPFPYSRPGWMKGTYAKLFQAQFNGTDLICGVCNSKIDISSNDVNGKEVWQSKGGNVHQTKPAIDHDSPDWIQRLYTLKTVTIPALESTKGALSGKQKRELVVDTYHAPTLRLTHLKCNSAKPKAVVI